MYDLLIIGGGAAGLLTAALVSGEKIKTAVLERNNVPGKKLYATGNGRCNYLNSKADPSGELRALLEGVGIIGTEDEDGRLYPRSREAASVVRALTDAAERNGAQILCDCHVTDIRKKDGVFQVLSRDGRKFESRFLLIATGGKAGIQFGCYGEGYRWAQAMGHSLVKPVPALVPMECSEDISALHGVRARGKVTLLRKTDTEETVACEEGEIQFTKDSLSGICVMDLSRYVRLAEGASYSLSVDLFPEYTQEELSSLLAAQKYRFGDPFAGLVPDKLGRELGKEDLSPDRLARLAKDMRFGITGTRGWADAQTTSGGVPLSEIDERTMESKKTPGLYFAGEIVDYDGPCGGFNLANAWRTAKAVSGGVRGRTDGLD